MKNTDFKISFLSQPLWQWLVMEILQKKKLNEIKNIVANEIYFMGYDFEEPLKKY
jgi:hypothetical protein